MATATEIGRKIGAAIARDVLAEDDLPFEWTGLDAQDGDQLLAAGFVAGTPEWAEAEAAAKAEYDLVLKALSDVGKESTQSKRRQPGQPDSGRRVMRKGSIYGG